MACASSPSRLEPLTVSGVRRTVVRSYIPDKEIQIRHDADAAGEEP
jgi:hypothetical protein